jgi:signal transduction histidine kinase
MMLFILFAGVDIYCIYLITVSEDIRKNKLHILYLAGMVLYAAAGIIVAFLTDQIKHFALITSVAFVIIHVILLCDRYAKATTEAEEARLKEEELTRKTDFYRRMSHDLRTPLTIISTNIQMANRHEETDHELLTKSQNEIMRMAKMIDAALEDDGGESGVEE